jgi:hypothetical protein
MASSRDIGYTEAFWFFCEAFIINLFPLNWGQAKSGSALKLTRYVRSVA